MGDDDVLNDLNHSQKRLNQFISCSDSVVECKWKINNNEV